MNRPNPNNRVTTRLLAESGIAPGMRVLDIGCGQGDLTREVALLAGPGGYVVGGDVSDAALARAGAVPSAAGAAPIVYEPVDLAGDAPDWEPFDAIVARRVLMYLADPAQAIGRLARLLRPGGIVAIQEHADLGYPVGTAALPVHAALHRWQWQTVAAEGGITSIGLLLPGVVEAAGLSVESYRAEGIVLSPEDCPGLAEIARVMLPRLVAAGVASEAEIGLPTLGERLERELRDSGPPILWDVAYLIVARKPL